MRYTLCLLLLIVLLSNFVPAHGQDTSSTEISKKKILENFPSYSQEDYSWCAWVSAQMVLKYYGYTVSPEKIAVKTFELANQKWSQDAVAAKYNGLPPGLIHNYEDAIVSLSDNSLEIEEITSRNEEELRDKIIQSIDKGSPIIISSTAPWLYDLFANIEPTVPWLYKAVGDKYPGGPHVSVIVGYSRDHETNPQLATHPFKLSLFGVLPSLVSEPPVLRIQDPNTANFGVDTYWLSYGKFFDKITAPGEDLWLITVNKKGTEINSAEIPIDEEISAVDVLSIGVPPVIDLDSLKQLNQNGNAISPIEVINEGTVEFRSTISHPNGKKVKLQVELRRLDEYDRQFDDTKGGLKESDLVESGKEATAYAYGLIDGDYHWRARAVSEDGTTSEWVDFGSNDISEADFSVAAAQTNRVVTPKTMLAVVSPESGPSSVSNPSTSRELLKLKAGSSMYSVAFSPDGSKLATGSEDGTARIWDTANGEMFLELNTYSPVNSIAFSPDGSKLATGSLDGTTRIWDTANGEMFLELNPYSPVNSIAFSPDGSKLATGSLDGTARIWDTSSGEMFLELNPGSCVYSVAFSPDGSKLATRDLHNIRIWDTANGEMFLELNADDYSCTVAFSSDGSKLAAGVDGTTHIFDVASGKDLLKLNVDGDYARSIVFSSDGSKLATGGGTKTCIWDATSGEELLKLNIDSYYVYSVAFSPDGSKLATGDEGKLSTGEDGAACIWNVATG